MATNTIASVTDPSSISGVANADIATVGGVTFTQAVATPTYLVSEDFEGAGYEESWTENVPASSTVNEDYETVVLAGSQSLYLYNASGWDNTNTYTSFTGSSPVYFYLMVQVKTAAAGEHQIVAIQDSSGNNLFLIARASATQVKIYSGTANATVDYTMTAGTTYHMWGDYTKGSGANAVVNLYISANTTKPGSATAGLTTGSVTADAARIKLQSHTSTTTREVVFDKVRVSTSDIGSDPS